MSGSRALRLDRPLARRSLSPLARLLAAAPACCPSPAPTSSTTRSRSSSSRPSPTWSIRWRSPSTPPSACTWSRCGTIRWACRPTAGPAGPSGCSRTTIGTVAPTRARCSPRASSFPTSVTPWQGGVFVTAPPQILYLEDRDGDRRADLREVVYDGFTLGVTDSNVNGLRWAIDNHIHGANGGNGGRVGEHVAARSRLPLRSAHAGVRDHLPDRGRLRPRLRRVGPELRSLQHRSPAAAHRAGALPGAHAALPPLDATTNVSVHGAMARIFPISAPSTRPNHPEQAGHYSAAGGIGWLDFEGEGLPRGLLVCDVVGNLVSREVPREDGPVVVDRARARGARARVLRQPRPGVPADRRRDGPRRRALPDRHAARHHRAPRLHSGVATRALDLRAGSDRGRIYRIVPRRGLPRPRPPLAGLSSDRLVAELGSPSRWRRDTAQRLLYERADASPRRPARDGARRRARSARPTARPVDARRPRRHRRGA